ncbi:MAG: cell division protein ZipA C-terminal FtsZ-binding domain-containing protein [Gammaproteobacteria bacterium]|jgi:cell division protein ZipA
MDLLRWIILGVGLVVLLAIYLHGRWRAGQRAERRSASADVPASETLPEIRADRAAEPTARELHGQLKSSDENAPSPVPETPAPSESAASPAEEAESSEEQLVVLHVAAQHGSNFTGAQLIEALTSIGMYLAEHDIYHFDLETPTGPMRLFSAANMLKPGTLSEAAEEDFESPGVSLFMQLPLPIPVGDALGVFVEKADSLAFALGGVVLDADRSLLTPNRRQALKVAVSR